MSVEYSLATGEPLAFRPGLPDNYAGPVIRGAYSRYSTTEFGQIISQELSNDQLSFARRMIYWKKPAALLCSYNYAPGIFTRTLLDRPVHEFLKGAGEVRLRKEEFASLAGSSWKAALLPPKAGWYTFLDMQGSLDMIEDVLVNDLPLQEIAHNMCPGLPERLMGRPHTLNGNMQSLLGIIQGFDYSSASSFNFLRHQVKKYFRIAIKESGYTETAGDIRRDDWQIILLAKELIDDNPGKHFTIPEISVRVGMNEYKLKKLFPKVTGLTMDEYRKYYLCIKAAKEIMRSDKPVKSFYEEAGYTGASTFIRGFRKLMYCTPGELREEQWNLSDIPGRLFTVSNFEL
ncbi:MAG: AraC family transcriptional regulator [Flavitalea sp.]